MEVLNFSDQSLRGKLVFVVWFIYRSYTATDAQRMTGRALVAPLRVDTCLIRTAS